MVDQLSKNNTLQKLKDGQNSFFEFSMYLLRLDFKDFSLGVAYNLAVKVLTFISVLLPIKILLFLAPNQKLPEVLASFFEDKNQLVIFLCFLMIIFMIFASFFSKRITRISAEKVTKIVDRSVMAISKSDIKAIKKRTDACMMTYASVSFLTLCLVLEYFVYPELLLVFFILLVVFYLFLQAFGKGKLSIPIVVNAPSVKIIKSLTKGIFLGLFFYIIYDVLINNASHSFIELILGLLLIRQANALLGMYCLSMVQFGNKENLIKAIIRSSE